jgi:acyl-CoA thioesterase-2
MHTLFLLPTQPAPLLDFSVERLRDGRSYAARRVTARQGDAVVFVGQYSFVLSTNGAAGEIDHQQDAAGLLSLVSDPGTLPTPRDVVRRLLAAQKLPQTVFDAIARRPFFQVDLDVRLPMGTDVTVLVRAPDTTPRTLLPPDIGPTRDAVYFCVPHSLDSDDPALHIAVAAYVSDHMLLGTALRPAGSHVWSGRPSFMATVDHCVWIHRPFRVDRRDGDAPRWLLYVMESPRAVAGRGYAAGRMYAPREMLLGGSEDLPPLVHVLSCTQEGVLRVSPVDRSKV